ncbi:Rossmann-like and DUF2520 domain-containing protein [Portibacter marinus]|uniref:Rossmann-like and DUF2520 domain-containing protein n=1 Tax=Portibacter marinus TaxID=2898660 RepID=UPI001F298B2E|nr:DUF2520 domain-containing protein [Portibacter marinus]
MQKGLCVGTGNLAWHFIPALINLENTVELQVLGRNQDAPKWLKDLSIDYITTSQDIDPEIEFVFLMVSDTSIPPLTQDLKEFLPSHKKVVHFSGTATIDAIDDHFTDRGSVWPIQSLSKGDHQIDLSKIPLCIHGSSPNFTYELRSIFQKITSNIHLIEPEIRPFIHVAAVLANNFTNHLYALSKSLLDSKGVDFEILKPIIVQTALKVRDSDPQMLQTGPASRQDMVTVEEHLSMLEFDPVLQKLYELFTQSIINSKYENRRLH